MTRAGMVGATIASMNSQSRTCPCGRSVNVLPHADLCASGKPDAPETCHASVR
ncbi:MAG TPA: hypothetical protein VGE97_08620 [Nitrososphaera sp.]